MLPSHAAFVPGIAIAVAQSPPLPELALLQSSVLALSLAYHRNFERTGALAHAEGEAARRTKKLLGLHASAHDGGRPLSPQARSPRPKAPQPSCSSCTEPRRRLPTAPLVSLGSLVRKRAVSA